MMRLTHIAAGADGSDEGKDAVALAAGLASLTGAGLSLVNVFPTTLFPTAGTDDRATLRKQADESLWRDRDELAPDAIIHSVADLSVSRALMHAGDARGDGGYRVLAGCALWARSHRQTRTAAAPRHAVRARARAARVAHSQV